MPVRARCNCGYRMELPDEWAGKQGRCPQCGNVLQIPPLRGVAVEPAAPARRASVSEPRPEIFDVSEPADSDEKPSDARWFDLFTNPAWLAAIAAGVMCLVLGLFIAFRSPSPRDSDEGQASKVTTAAADNKRDDVFRPTTRPDDARVENGSPTPAPDADSSHVASTKASRTPPAATKDPKGSENSASLDAWNTFEFGVFIPIGAMEIEIDGVALPVRSADELAGQGRTGLVLPLGRHVVRFARTGPPRVVEPKRWFLDAYREAAAQVQEDGRLSFDRLLELSRRKMDRFTDPLVPHLWGNYYWQEGQLDAAARHYQWALSIAPTFAPSYLNLAQLSHERGDDAKARRFLRLAELWNVQNAYGFSMLATSLGATLDAAELPPPDEAEADEPDWYVAERDALSARDRDMMAVLKSAAEFAPRVSERAKILNNLGAYFEHAGKADLALEHYRAAAGVFGDSKLSREDSLVIRGILENLARLCRKADMAEYQRYERLQAMMQ